MNRLRLALLLSALLLLGPAASVQARGGKAKKPRPPAFPSHVVLVIVGGGVRTQDLLDETLMPTVAAMASSGHVVRKVVSNASNGYTAAARLLTGSTRAVDGSAKSRPALPTLCEIVRAQRELPREKVWFVSFEGGDQLHLAHSSDAHHGAVFAPSIAYGQGAFAQPLASFLETLGRPVPLEPETWTQLRRLRLLSRTARRAYLPTEVDAGLPNAERVERALLRELDRKALLNRGPNPRDEQATRAARTVLEVHRPTLTVIRYGEAGQAQASYAAYRAVLAANDRGLARLRKAVLDDARMAGRTTFVVVTDRGRNEKPDAKGRLGADDASKQRGTVAVVIDGPGLARKPRLKGPRSIDDLAPTIAYLLGCRMPDSDGTPWLGLLRAR